ncbi:MAG: hypothetical protein OXG37_02365 [Actinomycetia bacterium]|nr:hypothetical protein [Actinomycetes bacterium]
MCVLCGTLLSDHWAEIAGGRRARDLRVRLLNRVLGYWGLSLADWAGAIYTIRDRKGRSVVVQDVGALWTSAEQLAGRPLDPLDPGLLAALEADG